MDYHMLKNQNFCLASIQPCVSPILPKLILMIVSELKLPHNTYSFHQMRDQHLSEKDNKANVQQGSLTAQLCPTAALFNIPFTGTQASLYWWLLG